MTWTQRTPIIMPTWEGESSWDLNLRRRITCNYVTLRAEELVFPSGEPTNWLSGVKWSVLHKNNTIWTEQVVFTYLGMHVCLCVCITSLKKTRAWIWKRQSKGGCCYMHGRGWRESRERRRMMKLYFNLNKISIFKMFICFHSFVFLYTSGNNTKLPKLNGSHSALWKYQTSSPLQSPELHI